MRRVSTTHENYVIGFALEKNSGKRLLVANLTDEPRTIDVRGLAGSVNIHRLDQHNLKSAITTPESFGREAAELTVDEGRKLVLKVPPYGIVRLDQSP